MKHWQLILSVCVIALVAALGGYQLQQYTVAEEPLNVTRAKPLSPEDVIGAYADEFSLADVEGELRYLSEWQGKVVAINFWATWCTPCREEIPAFTQLQHHYQSEGLQFVGIALQHAEEVRGFLAEFKVNYPSLVGGDDVIKIAKKLGNGIGALPYTVIIGRDGKIAFTRRGPLSKNEAESVIQSLL
jgi:thiol-disulfide isomerase/thioredoxin